MGKAAAPAQSNVEAFIKRWTDREGGAERANYALFLVELCDLIGVQRPDPAGRETERNQYVFERDDAKLVAMLRQTLRSIGKPAQAKDIAQRFREGPRGSRRVERGLKLLAAAGVVRRTGTGWFLPADRAAHHGAP